MSKLKTITPSDLEQAFMPEDYFLIPEQATKEINSDVLSVLLQRGRSVLLLIESDGEEVNKGFRWNHKVIMDGLSTVSGLIEQSIQVVDHSGGSGYKVIDSKKEDKS